jgi:hypothetical protein
MVGESARDINRVPLAALRKVEKKTRLRAEWALRKCVERFFDYVPKGSRKICIARARMASAKCFAAPPFNIYDQAPDEFSSIRPAKF